MSDKIRSTITKRLRDEITRTTDPNMLVKLTEQLNKMMPKQRRTKPLEEPKKKTTQESTFVKAHYPRGADFLEKLPMGEREVWRLILGVEAIPGHSTMRPEQRNAAMGKMIEGFSEAERTALEAYERELKSKRCLVIRRAEQGEVNNNG